MRCFCHKDNRYARGILNGNIFTSEKSVQIKMPIGKKGFGAKMVYTSKEVDLNTFFDNFQEISPLELTVIEFEEDRLKNEFLVVRWIENQIECEMELYNNLKTKNE